MIYALLACLNLGLAATMVAMTSEPTVFRASVVGLLVAVGVYNLIVARDVLG